MITPTIKAISSPDVYSINDYQPTSEEFSIFLQVVIGDDRPGGDVFGLTVLSPSFVAKQAQEGGDFFGRGYLIMSKFDHNRVRTIIADLCKKSAAETWDEVAEKLNRVMSWEFEEYKPRT
jgi:hypothetical protein